MNEKFAEFLATLRKEKGLTQKQLADKLGVTNKAVSKWENDVAYPDITLLKTIAEALSTTVGELLGEEKETSLVAPEEVDISKLLLKVRVISVEGDNVNINLPVQLIEVFLKNSPQMLKGITSSVNVGERNPLENIDFTQIISLVRMGVIGKLIDVHSAEGDVVEIFVE